MTVKLVICGLEHTGTTLISDLFRQIPGVDSGFECGVLLRETPREFQSLQPFYSNMLKGWGITQDDLEFCCDVSEFDEFYRRLMGLASVLREETAEIFDKTPRYLSELSAILDRCECPIVVSYKDPRAIVFSDFKRAKAKGFAEWYSEYKAGKLKYVQDCYGEFVAHISNPRVTTVSLEDLAMNSRNTMERMFAHAGEQFRLSYSVIDRVRYSNVKSRTVSPEIVFEYRSGLTEAEQTRILDDFGRFEKWVYE